jgi:hypothetical protein
LVGRVGVGSGQMQYSVKAIYIEIFPRNSRFCDSEKRRYRV